MIKSDVFYTAFAKGFASQQTSPLIAKRRGKIPKYYAPFVEDEVSFWFKVNSKASAFPNLPGEFWPVIVLKNMRYNEQDGGLVSWYQYADDSMNDEMTAFQWSVYTKVEKQTEFELPFYRSCRDSNLMQYQRNIQNGFQVGWPHTALLYLDEHDAEFWGKLFAVHLLPWMAKFCTQPETLKGYMWRMHWGIKAGTK
jgi:hypothetical protein